MNTPPNGPPPGGYGAPPPPDAYGAPPGGYGAPPPGFPQGGYPAHPAPMVHAPYGIEPVSGLPYSDKSKVVAGLLNILLLGVGFGGIGRLYLGHIGLGIAQLLLGWATCGIWPLVDGIMMLMGKVNDAQGRPLRE